MIIDILMKNGQIVGLVDSDNIAGESFSSRYWGIATGSSLQAGSPALKDFYRLNPGIVHYHYYGRQVGLSLDHGNSCGNAPQIWGQVRDFLASNKEHTPKLHAFTLPRRI